MLIIFGIALSLSFFWVLGRRDFALFARYTHRGLLQAPPYFAHISTVSRRELIPARILTIAVYRRFEFPSLRIVPYHSTPPTPTYCETTVVVYWLYIPTSGCPSPRVSLVPFPCYHWLTCHPFRILYLITRIYPADVGLPPPSSFHLSIR